MAARATGVDAIKQALAANPYRGKASTAPVSKQKREVMDRQASAKAAKAAATAATHPQVKPPPPEQTTSSKRLSQKGPPQTKLEVPKAEGPPPAPPQTKEDVPKAKGILKRARGALEACPPAAKKAVTIIGTPQSPPSSQAPIAEAAVQQPDQSQTGVQSPSAAATSGVNVAVQQPDKSQTGEQSQSAAVASGVQLPDQAQTGVQSQSAAVASGANDGVQPPDQSKAEVISPSDSAAAVRVKTELSPDKHAAVHKADKDVEMLSPAEKKKLNDARHRRFHRALEPAPVERAGRAKRCPPHLALKIKAASPQTVREYLQIYGECDEDWALVEIAVEARESKLERSLWMDGWFTRKQLLEKHNQDEAFVDGIIKEKLKSPGLWMAHPDNPASEAHRLYRALDYIADSRVHDKEQTKKLSMTAALDQGGVAAVSPLFLSPQASHTNLPGHTPLALTDAEATESYQPKVETDQEKALREFQAKELEKAEKLAAKKAENQRIKELPETQAAKWVKQLDKQLRECRGLLASIGKSDAPAETKKSFTKEFKAEHKAMEQMRDQLKASTPEEAVPLIQEAPALEVQFKGAMKRWKKVAKVLGVD